MSIKYMTKGKPDPETGVGSDLLQQTRWGFALVVVAGIDADLRTKNPCGGGGYLFRKHLFRKTGVCRRCGEVKAK